MKEKIKELFDDVIKDTPYSTPIKYYGKLQTLAGLVYNPNDDKEMVDELVELSKYVQMLVNLGELEDNIRNLVPRPMDFHHMFDTGIGYRHQNLTQATVNFPQTINFPEQNYEISETLINSVVENFKKIEVFDFNVSKIIAFIRSKITT